MIRRARETLVWGAFVPLLVLFGGPLLAWMLLLLPASV